jgi:hypothetical protein
LPWQGGLTKEYEPDPFLDEIEELSEQIKVISEDNDKSPEFEEALKIMNDATNIIFLGFGYHDNNLRRLRIKEFGKKRPIGSAHELGLSEREEIQGNWGIKLPGGYGEVLEFLKNHVILN